MNLASLSSPDQNFASAWGNGANASHVLTQRGPSTGAGHTFTRNTAVHGFAHHPTAPQASHNPIKPPMDYQLDMRSATHRAHVVGVSRAPRMRKDLFSNASVSKFFYPSLPRARSHPITHTRAFRRSTVPGAAAQRTPHHTATHTAPPRCTTSRSTVPRDNGSHGIAQVTAVGFEPTPLRTGA